MGRVREKLAAWDLAHRTGAEEQARMQRARELDAAEFGRQSDERARARSEAARAEDQQS